MTPRDDLRDDIELYVMNEYDGDAAALERTFAEDPALAALAADEARLELLLRDAADAATFCPACGDLAPDTRCDACGAAIRPGGYTVERVLVAGAHGRMYVARDADGTCVALKELAFVQSPTLEAIAAFEREAKLLRALEHPAIPRFVASFEEGTGVHTRYYLAQELVTGESLADRLDEHFFSEAELVALARQVLDVLVYLQGLSPMVIHRDIKPANLIRTPDDTIAVVDFGAAHVQGATAGSTSIGTFGYMPVEQLAGEVDATTDPYALGASLLHLSSRREPWRILQGNALADVNLSAPMRAWLGKLTASDPAARFANAKAARDALDRVARGEEPVAVAAIETIKKTRTSPSWWRPLALAAAALALVAGGFGVHALLASRDDGSPTKSPAVAPLVTGTIPTAPESPAPPATAKLRLRIGGTPHAKLLIDGRLVRAIARDGDEVSVAPGRHFIQLIAPSGERCSQTVVLAGKSRTVGCALRMNMAIKKGKPPHADADHPNGKFRPDQCTQCHKPGKFDAAKTSFLIDTAIPPGKKINLDVTDAPIHTVLRTLAVRCNLGLVVSSSIDFTTTLHLEAAPCDQALEVVLQAHDLWYRYHVDTNVVRVGPRHELDREDDERMERADRGFADDPLPAGPAIDLDLRNAPLQDVLRELAAAAKVNIVVPDEIDGKVTVHLVHVPWDAALTAVLGAQDLWYRYRPNGKLLRIAPRHELDREDDEAAARGRSR